MAAIGIAIGMYLGDEASTYVAPVVGGGGDYQFLLLAMMWVP
jgi:hypothetical protein